MSRKRLDLTNKRFGKLVALYPELKNNRTYWYCKCDCGNFTSVQVSCLTKNITKSCGCLQKKATKTRRQIKEPDKKLLNRKFNLLTVIGFNGYKLICKCDCGNIIEIFPSDIYNNHIKSCGCLKKSKASRRMNNINKTVFKENTNIYRIASKKLSKNNTTGEKGVFKTKKGYYVAMIGFKNKKIYLGSFTSFQKAVQARKEAEEKYYKPILEKYNRK